MLFCNGSLDQPAGLPKKSSFFFKTFQNSCKCKVIGYFMWSSWIEFPSECSLDLLDALRLFVFDDDDACCPLKENFC